MGGIGRGIALAQPACSAAFGIAPGRRLLVGLGDEAGRREQSSDESLGRGRAAGHRQADIGVVAERVRREARQLGAGPYTPVCGRIARSDQHRRRGHGSQLLQHAAEIANRKQACHHNNVGLRRRADEAHTQLLKSNLEARSLQ